MSDLISRQALLDLCHNHIDGKVDANDIARMPSAEKTDTVSLEAYKQVIAERDIAIQQLKELGYEFGEKIEQDFCGDLISRQAVEEIINDIRDCISVEGYWAIIERLKRLPSVKNIVNNGTMNITL